jgi:hypothetical protein
MERHRTDLLSFVAGMLFVALAVVGLSDRLELSAADIRWVAPGILVLLGVLLVLPIGRGRPPTRDVAALAPSDQEASGWAQGVAGDPSPYEHDTTSPTDHADPDEDEPDRDRW